jgi:hypothetical protein
MISWIIHDHIISFDKVCTICHTVGKIYRSSSESIKVVPVIFFYICLTHNSSCIRDWIWLMKCHWNRSSLPNWRSIARRNKWNSLIESIDAIPWTLIGSIILSTEVECMISFGRKGDNITIIIWCSSCETWSNSRCYSNIVKMPYIASITKCTSTTIRCQKGDRNIGIFPDRWIIICWDNW